MFRPILRSLVGAAAIGAIGVAILPSSRFVALLIYVLVFATLCYWVAVSKGLLQNVLLAAASIAFGLGAIETGVLLFGKQSVTEQARGSFSTDTPLGWAPARAGVIREKKVAPDGVVIYDVAMTIDDHRTRVVDSPREGPTVAFYGDSFTFGVGLQDRETMPQALADLLERKYRVLNLAGPGYSPSQFLRAVELGLHDDLLPKDTRLVVFLTSPWHAVRTGCKVDFVFYAPSYDLENGAPALKGNCAARFPAPRRLLEIAFRSTPAFRYFFAQREGQVTRADLDLYIAMLIQAGKIVREKYGAPTLLLYLPDDMSSARYARDGVYGNDEIVAKLREGALDVVDATLDGNRYGMQHLFIPGDGHPTGLAAKIWAGQIKDYLEKSAAGATAR
jgi:hypothetical protein